MTLEEIMIELRQKMREEREQESEQSDLDAHGFFYGPAYIKVTHLVEVWHDGNLVNPADESVLTTFWWDHSVWSLEEAVNMARRGEGKVYVGQYMYCHEDFDDVEDHNPSDPDGLQWTGEGFEFEVWPTWTGKAQ